MNSKEVLSISSSIVLLSALIKWMGGSFLTTELHGGLVVLAFAAIGIALYAYSKKEAKPDAFSLFAAWVTVSAAAAGIFGFASNLSDPTKIQSAELKALESAAKTIQETTERVKTNGE